MFEYQKLDLKGSGFRLVRLQKGNGEKIECELIHTTLDDNVIPYEAVSYTWGTLKREKYIRITGGILPVTSNLWQVLHDLRRLDLDRYLWVDGICINQDDDLERGHQVQQMRHIYQGADRGIFYLSPHTAVTQVIMESLALLQKQVAGSRWASNDGRWDAAWQKVQTELRSQYDDLESRQREGLAYLLLSPFFRRVWIVQEVASVRRASVFCGTSSIPAHIFAICTRIEKTITNSHTSAVIGLMLKSLDTTTTPLQGKRLATLLTQFGDSEASDDRDRIYALLGLCDARKNAHAVTITPDYRLLIHDVIILTFAHIYGPAAACCLPANLHFSSVDDLICYLRKPMSELIVQLLELGQSRYEYREALVDCMNGAEAPITISYFLAIELLRCLLRSRHRPIEAIHNYVTWLDIRVMLIPHDIISLVMENTCHAEILRLLCQSEWEVVIDAQVSFILKTRHTEMLKILMEPCKAKVVIHVSMMALWVILLLVPNDNIEALIPLLEGVESRTKAALTHLGETASKLAGSFRGREAILLLWRLTGDTRSEHDNDSAPIKSRDCLGSRRRLSLDGNQIAEGHERTAEPTSSILRHHISRELMNIDSQIDPSPIGKWRPDMSNPNCSSHLCGTRGRSWSI